MDKKQLKSIIKEEYQNVKSFMEYKYGFTPELGKVISNPYAKSFVNEVKEPEVISQLRDILKNKQNAKIKDPVSGKKMRVDSFSASAVIAVYDAINDSNKKNFGKLSLPKMVNVAFKVAKVKKESVNEILTIVDKFDAKKQDYDKMYYKDGGDSPGDGDLKKAKKELAKLSKKHKGLTLVSVGRNSKMYDVMKADESLNEAKFMDKNKKFKVYDKLKKGDKIRIKFGNAIRKDNETVLVVTKGKTKVGKAQVERIILKNPKNPNGVKYYLYNRDGNVSLAKGDMAAVIVDMIPESIDESVNEVKVNYNFSEEELKRVLKLLGRNASTEVKMIKAFEKAFGRKLTRDELFESINESTGLAIIHKAAKKGSYPVSIVATMLGKVVKQELVKTPMAVPAAFRMMQGGYPRATIAIEDRTGKILFKEGFVKESVNEGKHDVILDKLADMVKNSKSFMDVGKELKKNGIKYSFGTSPLPMYIIDKPVKIAILNNKYADGAERVVGTTAIGLMESVNEGMFKVIDQIRQDSKDAKDFIKNVFSDADFKDMRKDKEFLKYLKSIYEGFSVVEEYDVENEQDIKEFINFMKEYKADINEAEYQGRDVKLGKIMQGDVKKFKVYVKNPKGNVVKVNFGHKGKGNEKTMSIKKNNPERRKAFRARHNCDNPGPRHKARYWSCKKW